MSPCIDAKFLSHRKHLETHFPAFCCQRKRRMAAADTGKKLPNVYLFPVGMARNFVYLSPTSHRMVAINAFLNIKTEFAIIENLISQGSPQNTFVVSFAIYNYIKAAKLRPQIRIHISQVSVNPLHMSLFRLPMERLLDIWFWTKWNPKAM